MHGSASSRGRAPLPDVLCQPDAARHLRALASSGRPCAPPTVGFGWRCRAAFGLAAAHTQLLVRR
ncbi:hypothetical protein C8Q77DRAFT_1119588 [Trametes polyzona]|nr:hypothetical protein C8Q77DRAFT_1119588 [Trametes polyzona]